MNFFLKAYELLGELTRLKLRWENFDKLEKVFENFSLSLFFIVSADEIQVRVTQSKHLLKLRYFQHKHTSAEP